MCLLVAMIVGIGTGAAVDSYETDNYRLEISDLKADVLHKDYEYYAMRDRLIEQMTRNDQMQRNGSAELDKLNKKLAAYTQANKDWTDGYNQQAKELAAYKQGFVTLKQMTDAVGITKPDPVPPQQPAK